MERPILISISYCAKHLKMGRGGSTGQAPPGRASASAGFVRDARTEAVMVKRQRLLVAVIVSIEVCSAVFAWRDLAHRSDDQVRGTKNLWRALVSLNPGNSAIYWLFGRR